MARLRVREHAQLHLNPALNLSWPAMAAMRRPSARAWWFAAAFPPAPCASGSDNGTGASRTGLRLRIRACLGDDLPVASIRPWHRGTVAPAVRPGAEGSTREAEAGACNQVW